MELADNENAECGVQNAECTPVLQDPGSYSPRTLRSELQRRGRLPLEECMQIGLSLAEALAHLHRQGLVHRDIKPSNIIFVGGVPKLADVGLVAAVADARSFVGTEGFIPPEGPGTLQADLYSLGIVLYVLSTGKSYQDFPEPPADLSAQENHAQWLEFNAVVHKACQAQVSDRYQSAAEMRDELALLQRGQSIREKRAVRGRWRVAKKLVLVTVALALLLTPLRFLKQRSRHRYTAKPEAVRLYELGRWHYNQLTPTDHAKALDYLSRAIQADPKFVQPYGEWMMLYTWNMVPDSSTEQRRLEHTREIANKALAVDPNAGEGHTALSWCKFLQRDWRGAEDEILRAIRLNPNLPIAHDVYCFYLSLQSRTDEARREAQRALELEPPSSARVSAIIASWPFTAERRHDLAIAQLKRVLDLDRNFATGHDYLGDCYEAASNYVAAIEEYKAAELLQGKDPNKVNAYYRALRDAYDARGEEGYLRKFVELLLADHSGGRALAGYYARLGEKEKALAEIETHFDEPQEWHQIKFLPMYDTLHDEPRFKALVRQAGLRP